MILSRTLSVHVCRPILVQTLYTDLVYTLLYIYILDRIGCVQEFQAMGCKAIHHNITLHQVDFITMGAQHYEKKILPKKCYFKNSTT